VHLGEAG